MAYPAITTRRQGTYWIGTLPDTNWEPQLQPSLAYIRGQLERGEGGLEHYQLFFITSRKMSLAQIRELWAPFIGHWELTRSSAAESYVWKEETRIGDPFEFGERPFKRNSKTDWAQVKELAVTGDLEQIEPDIFIRYYANLCRIRSDYVQPTPMERRCTVLWGKTGTGKSHRCWEHIGPQAYSKDPRTKFWCGYKYQTVVIIDEFRGSIDISHLLRWFDKYPVRVEIKGSSMPLCASRFFITSNLHPREWYQDLDATTFAALERRLEIIEVTSQDQIINFE